MCMREVQARASKSVLIRRVKHDIEARIHTMMPLVASKTYITFLTRNRYRIAKRQQKLLSILEESNMTSKLEADLPTRCPVESLIGAPPPPLPQGL